MSTPASPSASAIVVIGNFDGVHRGHRALLAHARTLADARTPVIALTFEPHPTAWFRGWEPETWRLVLPEQRIALLRDAGADDVVVLPFDDDMASMSPEDFVRDILVHRLQARAVVVGEDFRFGARRAGTVETLRRLGDTLGMHISALPAVMEGDAPVSSTRIREALRRGDMALVEHLLGRPWTYAGEVESGFGRGRKMGIPTLNLYPRDLLLPPHGVYASWLTSGGKRWASISNLGIRPTFADDPRVSLETLVLVPFEGPAEDGRIEVELVGYVRPEQAFPSPEALKAQIGHDVAHARAILGLD